MQHERGLAADRDHEARRLATRLRQAIYRIVENLPSADQSIVEQYARAISVDAAQFQGQPLTDRFPFPLRPHRGNPDADATSYANPLFVLGFHIGNAIRVVHEFALGRDDRHRDARINRVLEIADNGPLRDNWRVWGEPRHGYYLVTCDEYAKLATQAAEAAAQTEADTERRITGD